MSETFFIAACTGVGGILVTITGFWLKNRKQTQDDKAQTQANKVQNQPLDQSQYTFLEERFRQTINDLKADVQEIRAESKVSEQSLQEYKAKYEAVELENQQLKTQIAGFQIIVNSYKTGLLKPQPLVQP